MEARPAAPRAERRPSTWPFRLAVTVPAALLLSILALDHLPRPFFWLCAIWAAACIAGARSTDHRMARIVFGNVAVLCCLLAAIEGVLLKWPDLGRVKAPMSQYTGDYARNGGHAREPTVLGYAPRPNQQCSAGKVCDGVTVYDVVYTIDAKGLRVTPAAPAAKASILCFGCSFTFGEGVRDEESMPYQLGLKCAPDYHVLNFGYHGYGPHQMLAALDHGLIAPRLTVPPRVIVYQALPDHVRRAAGLSSWDLKGPCYQLASDGRVEFRGAFDEALGLSGIARDWFRLQAGKSALGRRLYFRERPASRKDESTFFAIVAQARHLAQQQWPGVRFEVILWDDASARSLRIEQGLTQRGIAVHRVSQIVPDILTHPAAYEIPVDKHPNALAYGLIADYIRAHLIPPATDAPRTGP